MRSKLVVFVIVVALAAVPVHAQNQIPNWEFDTPATLTSIWNLWQSANFTGITIVEGAGLSGRYAMKVDCGTGSLDPLQFFRSYLKLEQGKKYYISFMAKAVTPRPISVGLEARALYNWVTYWQTPVQLTTEAQLFNFTYTHTGATVGGTGVFDSDIDLQFWLAGNGTDFYLDRVWMGTEPPPPLDKTRATDPVPIIGATDIPVDPSLSWSPGVSAKTHNVYLGTSFADVNTADLSKAVSKGQTGTTFKPASLLEYGKTYYWRVDEVNAAPSNTVFKGEVWSFTVEPYAYPITNIAATASSSDKTTTGPANTVNGSGLTNDLHSTTSTAMWLSSATGPTPAWIQYQFDKVYKLQELWVWNQNTDFEPVLGYGFKDVTIETSTDGTKWTPLKDTQFAQATALAGYAHNTTVDLGGVMAQYVRLTAKSNWSLVSLKQYGLSEVRFYYVPVQARAPQPAFNTKDVGVNTGLDWRPGRDATSQKVYLGTDKAAVTNGTAPVKTVTEHGFAPGALDFGTTYYWKVDEVGATTYPGDVWKFVTQEYVTVDNFESYNDKVAAKTTIFDTWIDGYADGFKSSGSTVGNENALNGTFGETQILHGGKQSMPFAYDNTKTPFYSEAQRTFDTPLDWTTNGATTLALWYQGYPAALTETASGITLSGAGADIYQGTAEFRFAYKQLTGDGSITVRLDSAQTAANWTKTGVMIRQSLDPLAMQVHMISAARQSLVEWMYRSATNSTVTTQFNTAAGTNPLPVWLRLTRAGNVFTGECSADGKTWTKITSGTTSSSTTIAMSGPVYIGMVVCSNSAGNFAVGNFSQINTTGNVSAQWQTADVGVAQPSNGAAPLYVTVTDKAGKSKTVVNPNPAAVNASVWTQWQIALSDLTGVNLAAVKKLTIGAGDRANPKAGGTGKLYVDDIGVGKPAVRDLTNYAVNGGFETGALAPWSAGGGGGATTTAAVVTACTGANVPEAPIEGKYCLNLNVSGPSANFWDCSLSMTAPTFVKGTKYTLSAFFKVKSGTGRVNIKPEHAGGTWEGYGEKQVTITDKWVEYYVTTPVFAADVTPTDLRFHIGFQAQELWVDNIKFYEGDYIPSN